MNSKQCNECVYLRTAKDPMSMYLREHWCGRGHDIDLEDDMQCANFVDKSDRYDHMRQLKKDLE